MNVLYMCVMFGCVNVFRYYRLCFRLVIWFGCVFVVIFIVMGLLRSLLW